MSILATLLTLAFIGWLLHTEVKRRGHLPTTMWIPFIWFLVKASRPVALWFRTGGVDEISGNPYDAVLDLVLIIGAYLIVRNKHPWKRIWESNPYFSLIVIFFLISVVWSPFPYVAMKRWVREVGNILMALVILTDAKPAETLKTLGVRCAYILLPLSELLVRFFPEFGRVYTNGGAPTITGVTTQKNELGIMCAILGLLLVWDILDTWRERKLTGKKISLVAQWIALGWILRFLHTSDSKTSILALALGCVILLSTYLKSIRNRPVLFGRACVLLVITGLLAVTFVTTKLSWVFNALGRDVTFTERDGIWAAVLDMPINPLIGNGFFSFWLRWGPTVGARFVNFIPRSAHNGYLETYLDGGIIGCVLLGIFLLWTSFKAARGISHERSTSRLVLAIMMMALVSNFTEAYFFRLDLFWLCIVVASLSVRGALLSEPSTQTQVLKRDVLWPRAIRAGVVSR